MDQSLAQALRSYSESRIESLRNYRLPWWAHWAQLAAVYLPRRYRWFITPNNYARGTPINGQIVDETGVLAARTLATGLLANLTSPTSPWFRFGLHGVKVPEDSPTAIWLAQATSITLDVLAGSNFYTSLGTAYHDNGVFGSASIIEYEDDKDVVRFLNPCLGEFFFGLDKRLTVDTLYREYTYTIQECVDEFGLNNCSPSIQSMYRSGGSSRDTEVVIGHAIEPNSDVYSAGVSFGQALSSIFKYREVYWERANNAGPQAGLLRLAGFREKPFVGLRWDVTSNDAYGRSPGMDAYPAVMQLQIEQRRKAEAIDKMVRPPMVGTVAMKNEPSSILPGSITYTTDPKDGFKPAFQVEPRIAEMMEDIKEVQQRVGNIFFNPLFTGITDLQTVRTATEIDKRWAEKLVLLGPVVERTENEGLDELLARTFAILNRRGLYPPQPPEMRGTVISINYISILAEAQRASATASIERQLQLTGGVVGVWNEAGDNIDIDEALTTYGDLLNVPPNLFRSAEAKAQIRANRSQQAQAQGSIAAGTALAQGAQTLSQTQVGGGRNALETLMGGNP